MNPTADYQLTVVVPVYNEQESLPDLFNALENYRNRASLPVCFLFVNDGSADMSMSLIKEWCLRKQGFFYLSFERHTGLTGALKAGVLHSLSPLTGFMDADLQTLPDDFELLLNHRTDAGLVCGIRAKADYGLGLKLKSMLFSRIRRLITRDDISDATCPLKLGRTDLLKNLPWYTGMHCFMPALIKMSGHRVNTVEVRYQRRMHGRSKQSFILKSLHGMADLLVFMWMRRNYLDPAVGESNLMQR